MNGIFAERFLRDDPQLERQRREQDRDVVDALVVGGEDVAARRIEALEPVDSHLHAGGLQDQPRPRARARVPKVAAPIERALDTSDAVPRTIV